MQRARIGMVAVVVGVLALASVAGADWNEGDFAKWVQLPDLNIYTEPGQPVFGTGLDVNATFPKVLAEDWLCTSKDFVTDFHIWGSWLFDEKPQPEMLRFWAGIYSNNPGDPAAGVPSHPEQLLWQREFVYSPDWCNNLTFTEREYARFPADVFERWYDPNTDEIVGTDQGVWQYNFCIHPEDAFLQEGGPDAGAAQVYWLALTALVPTDANGMPLYRFGWKSAVDHRIDDGVYADWVWVEDAAGGGHYEPPMPGDWVDLRYPIGHPLEGQTMDLSLVITPEPATLALLALGAGGAMAVRRRRK